MTNLDMSMLVIIVGIVASTCSIASFFLGRKKDATSEGQKSGVIENDIKNVSRQLEDMKNSFDKMNLKMDAVDEKRETEYRNMLVSMTELSTSYKTLHNRVDVIEKKLEFRTGGA